MGPKGYKYGEYNIRKAYVKWANMKANEIGPAFPVDHKKPLSVMVTGVTGGAEVALNASLDTDTEAQFPIMHNSSGGGMTFRTTPALENINEDCLQIRPEIHGGSDLTDITVTVLLAR